MPEYFARKCTRLTSSCRHQPQRRRSLAQQRCCHLSDWDQIPFSSDANWRIRRIHLTHTQSTARGQSSSVSIAAKTGPFDANGLRCQMVWFARASILQQSKIIASNGLADKNRMRCKKGIRSIQIYYLWIESVSAEIGSGIRCAARKISFLFITSAKKKKTYSTSTVDLQVCKCVIDRKMFDFFSSLVSSDGNERGGRGRKLRQWRRWQSNIRSLLWSRVDAGK